MGDNYAKLAKAIHERDNPKTIGPCIGTITKETQPITATICDGAVILEQYDNAKVCQSLAERTYEAQINGSKATVELKNVLKKGDQVLCIPAEGEQTWVMIDKVVG
jgi:hypothetical protein